MCVDGVRLRTPGQGVEGPASSQVVLSFVMRSLLFWGLMRTRFAVFHTQKPRERDEATQIEPRRR